MMKHIKVRGMEHFQPEAFYIQVSLGIIFRFLVVRSSVNFNDKSEPFHIKINDIVPNDFLSVEIQSIKHFLMYLHPKNDLSEISSLSVLAGKSGQFSVFRKVVNLF